MALKYGKIDLHIHSTASDGTWMPKYIVEKAKLSNVQLISLTDHDDIANVDECEKICKDNDVNFISGVEISSTHKGESIHILGYGVDTKSNEFNKFITENRIKLENEDSKSIRALISKGYNLSYEEYEKYEHVPERGGWKALNYLIDCGLCKDVGDFFENLLKREGISGSPEFPQVEETVKVIKAAGGVPVMAHPYYSKSDIPVNERLSEFMELGIEGVECFHPNQSREISEECAEWCRKNNMIITCGSDCHGDFIKTRCIGKPEVDASLINLGRLQEYII